MHKHWLPSHPELQEAPKFDIKVVSSFQDALSRQLSEAVRIESRGGNVLNSKAEYSRSRIPRLRIDKEEWKDAKEQKKKAEKAEHDHNDDTAREVERSLLEGGTAWDLSKKGGANKRKNAPKERKSKRRKFDLLVGWGESDESLEDNPGSVEEWLRNDHKEDPPTHHSEDKSERMKQMEINLKLMMTSKFEKKADYEKIVEKKLTKAEKLKEAATGSKKMTDWLIRKPNIFTEWDDDPDIPELEEIAVIEERKMAKIRVNRAAIEDECGEIIKELVSEVEAASAANNIMDKVWDDRKNMEDDCRRCKA